MKRVFLISLYVALFYIIETNAQSCGSSKAGPIIQQVAGRIDYAEGLFWTGKRLLFADRFYTHICYSYQNGFDECTKLAGVKEVSSIYPIKNVNDKFMIFADQKMMEISSNISENVQIVQQYQIVTRALIVSNPSTILGQTVTDRRGRTIIGANTKTDDGMQYSEVYIIDEDYNKKVLIPRNTIIKSTGIVLSSDYKNLFVADSLENVIYRYNYNEGQGTVGRHEVVFNKIDHFNLQGYISTLGIDNKNRLWISFGGTGYVLLYDYNKKKFTNHFKLPASYPTSICYGGPKLDVLFIGTTQQSPEYSVLEPGSGFVYAVSGTGTVGFQQNMLSMPTEKAKANEVKSYFSDILSKMAAGELNPVI